MCTSTNKDINYQRSWPLQISIAADDFPAEKISLTPRVPTPRNIIEIEEFLTSVCIPYLGTTSRQIERILASFIIKVYHCSNQKVYQLLYTYKDLTEKNIIPGTYHIPCTCGKVYNGETGRNLKVSPKEHKDCCLKCQRNKSALASKHFGKMATLLNGMNQNFWCQ